MFFLKKKSGDNTAWLVDGSRLGVDRSGQQKAGRKDWRVETEAAGGPARLGGYKSGGGKKEGSQCDPSLPLHPSLQIPLPP
jgi:hypothetical protein